MPRFLLDTHVALWWFTAHPRLTVGARETITHSECSIWEVAIKYRLGKLPIDPDVLLTITRDSNIHILNINPST